MNQDYYSIIQKTATGLTVTYSLVYEKMPKTDGVVWIFYGKHDDVVTQTRQFLQVFKDRNLDCLTQAQIHRRLAELGQPRPTDDEIAESLAKRARENPPTIRSQDFYGAVCKTGDSFMPLFKRTLDASMIFGAVQLFRGDLEAIMAEARKYMETHDPRFARPLNTYDLQTAIERLEQ